MNELDKTLAWFKKKGGGELGDNSSRFRVVRVLNWLLYILWSITTAFYKALFKFACGLEFT